jgi:nicotinamide-nucleotide adenylyltransferase
MMKTDCVPCILDQSSREPNGRHTDRLDRIGMVARWQPVHRGHVPVLRALCDRASQAFIGIGSSNRHNLRNPFTIEETKDMIRLVLADRENYTLIAVPDLDDGPRWRAMIIDLFGSLDLFVTDNPYVSSLLAADYRIMKPIALVPQNERIAVDGTMVRRAMARGGDWQALVPKEIADYIAAKRLADRFRREFGLQALAMDVITR